jgi:hypothetical protein
MNREVAAKIALRAVRNFVEKNLDVVSNIHLNSKIDNFALRYSYIPLHRLIESSSAYITSTIL